MRTRALSAKKLISSPSDGGAGSTDAPSKRPKAEDTVPEPERPSVDMHRVHGEVHDSDEVSDSESDDASETPEEEQARYAEIRAAVEARVKARLADLPAYSTSTDPDYHEADDEPLDADTHDAGMQRLKIEIMTNFIIKYDSDRRARERMRNLCDYLCLRLKNGHIIDDGFLVGYDTAWKTTVDELVRVGRSRPSAMRHVYTECLGLKFAST